MKQVSRVLLEWNEEANYGGLPKWKEWLAASVE